MGPAPAPPPPAARHTPGQPVWRDVAVWAVLLGLGWMLWTRADAAATFQTVPGPGSQHQALGTAPATVPVPLSGQGVAPGGLPARPVRPARLVVPAAGVDARVVELGLNRDGTLQVPAGFTEAGWWSGGSLPGADGPTVLVGHYDSRRGRAVFADLPALQPGDPIRVEDAEGNEVAFEVTRVERHRKDAFPTAAVYGPTARPTLRLVTCGGPYERRARSYRDNVIVFAELARAP